MDEGILFVTRPGAPQRDVDFLTSLITRDGDGLFYIDYIGASHHLLREPSQRESYLRGLGDFAMKMMGHRDPSVRVKYGWLRTKVAEVSRARASQSQA